MVKNLPEMQELQETRVQSLGEEDPLEDGMATHSSILAWRIHGQKSLVGCNPWGHRESDTTEVNKHIYVCVCVYTHIYIYHICIWIHIYKPIDAYIHTRFIFMNLNSHIY